MISSIESSWYSEKIRAMSSLTTESKHKKETAKADKSQDTVTISDEARALFAKIAAKGGNKPSGADANAPKDGQATGGSGSIGSVEDIKTEAEELEDVDGQIKELQDQIQTIMGSDDSPQEKMQQAEPLQAQIAQLQQQKAKLEASVLKSQNKSK